MEEEVNFYNSRFVFFPIFEWDCISGPEALSPIVSTITSVSEFRNLFSKFFEP